MKELKNWEQRWGSKQSSICNKVMKNSPMVVDDGVAANL